MGEGPVHITSNDFNDQNDEVDGEEDEDEVDDEHEYEVGAGIHDMILR
jgi:hypothetical protein